MHQIFHEAWNFQDLLAPEAHHGALVHHSTHGYRGADRAAERAGFMALRSVPESARIPPGRVQT